MVIVVVVVAAVLVVAAALRLLTRRDRTLLDVERFHRASELTRGWSEQDAARPRPQPSPDV